MSTFEINSEALDAAYRAMMGVCDTIESQRARHNQAHSGMEGMLANAASVVVAATGFDPFSIWEQWGFGGVAQTCSTTNWTVEQVRGTIQQLVREVSEAHRGELAPVLHDRAAYLRSTLDNAQERLQSITSLLNPGNLLHLLTSPWGILDPFSAASGALSLAHSLAQDYRDFLARLSAREKELIEEIRSRFETPTSAALPVTSVHSGSSLQGSNITIQGNSSTLQGGSGYLQGEQAPLTWGQRVGANAKKLEHYLTTTSTGKYRPYNGLDVDALVNSYPPDQRAHIRDLVNKVFQRDPANWLKSDGKTPDVQCVAFVALSYALTTGDPNFLPAKGNAGELWDAYSHNAVPGWTEVGNKAGTSGWPPQVGDMVPMTWDPYGHVAIVSHVYVDSNGNVTSIDIAQGNTPNLIQNLKVEHGVVDSPPGLGIQGFIRPPHP